MFKNNKPLTLVEQKQLSKSTEAYQQGVMIYLLVKSGFEVRVKRLDKSAKKTIQNYPIVSLKNCKTEEVIPFQQKVEEEANFARNREKKEQPSDQIQRHYERNKVTIACNRTIEFVEQLGFTIEQRGTRSTKYTVKLKKFSQVIGNGIKIRKEDIFTIGGSVMKYIKGTFGKNEESVIGVDLLNSLIFPNVSIDGIKQKTEDDTIIQNERLISYEDPKEEENTIESKEINKENKSFNKCEIVDEFDLGIDIPNEFIVKEKKDLTSEITGSIVHSYDPIFSFYTPNDINSKWAKK
ncbi:hypothetical protein EHI8A_005480 [Entamoeba histolytica HM-1:IMSS-B]|uniref:Uncharacterized protein n=6 Tax=Entamoeba histolytica TaxID=5759 RepID=C4LUY0_ENTH1|nr:hypothetical protein EHI_092150 [Entamoeba histolytica HM-1:IMSS]EMD47030.1 Hypothetical protein EHI5A_020340 [Entamoeba histolytica KU27]EMH73160.1 hypothetical protein EHI8A_005480 [Entamoeba histolytica HM-1:IMSS-B]EMS17601.1 hypothetical protein KM1_020750 [Entamoeba histolytica HM-3:IMSS]ENY61822.1 hypothetical protein EHI7A_008490 [Entamoeba histolytica HM-1:IMSS-A]GAT92448.1 hypothetical protein CL6EHI_092150 [Entamoeba histolytica]|eukprot:XP_654567.1 hypothetical protein EHI_092150 [Entamoeba histolytica HM-1:IMSS]